MKITLTIGWTLCAAAAAMAQNDTSWVSAAKGSDSNACTLAAPCRTFAVAYSKTNSSGIIKAMDPGEYGALNLGKPITLDGNGVGASIEANPFAAYGVSVSATAPVEIRNLAIHVAPGCSPCDGIDVNNSGVIIENVSITGAPLVGLYLATGPVTASVHGLTVTGATIGINVQDATASISDSEVRYSFTRIYVVSSSAPTQALIQRSRMVSNHNIGLRVDGNNSLASTARISDCMITANTLGTQTNGIGQILTFRNNAWVGNNTDGSTPFSVSLK